MTYIRTFILAILLAGTTTFAAQGSDATQGQEKYSKVVLWAVGFSDRDQSRIERASVKAFSKKGITAIARADLVPEGTTLSDAVLQKKLVDEGFDAIFAVSSGPTPGLQTGRANGNSRSVESALVFQQAGASNNVGAGGSPLGPSARVGMGGMSYKERNKSAYGLFLADLSTGEIIWKDTVVIRSRPEHKGRNMADRAMRKSAKELIKARYFNRTSKD